MEIEMMRFLLDREHDHAFRAGRSAGRVEMHDKGSDANKQIERLEQECTELRNRNCLLSEMGKTSRDILEGTVKGYEAAMKQQNEDIRATVTKYEEEKTSVMNIRAERNDLEKLLEAEKNRNQLLTEELERVTALIQSQECAKRITPEDDYIDEFCEFIVKAGLDIRRKIHDSLHLRGINISAGWWHLP